MFEVSIERRSSPNKTSKNVNVVTPKWKKVPFTDCLIWDPVLSSQRYENTPLQNVKLNFCLSGKKEHVHHDAINGFWVGACDGKILQVPRSFLLEPLKRCISCNDMNRKQIGRWKGLCLEDIGIDAVPNTSMQIYIYILYYICLYIDTVYFKRMYIYIYICHIYVTCWRAPPHRMQSSPPGLE